jgi:hypothetical protein
MEATIAAGHGPVAVASDDEGLSVRVSRRDLRWRWDELTGAGFAKHPGAGREAPNLPDEVATAMVGFRSLRSLGMDLARTHEALVVAWQRDRLRSFQVFLPMADPGTQALGAELATRLGDRWLGTGHNLDDLRRRLGVAYPRWYPAVATTVAFVVGLVTILPALLGFGLVRDAIQERDLEKLGEIEPLSWIAMALWIAFVVWLLARFGRLRRH